MFATIYIDPDEAMNYYTSQNLEYDYRITADGKMQSDNIVLLSALCLHVFGRLDRSQHHYDQIQNRSLFVGQINRSRSSTFMSRACSKVIDWMKQEYEAELILDFLKQDRQDISGLMVLKFESDLDLDETNPVKKPGDYVIVYEADQEISAIINDFTIKSIPICDLTFKRKLQLLGLINSHQSAQTNWYGFIKQGEVSCKIIERSDEPHSVRNSVVTEHSSIENILINTIIVLKFQHLAVYGTKSGVKRFQLRLEQEVNEIICKTYNRADEHFNSLLFTLRRSLAEHYHKCRLYSVEHGDFIEVYYHSSVKNIFNGQFLKNDQYQTMKVNNAVRSILKQPTLVSIEESNPDMVIYQDNQEGQMLMAKKQIISLIESIKQPKKLQVGSNKKPSPSEDQKSKLDFVSNVQVNQLTLSEMFNMSNVFKMQEDMNFKIDIGEQIRITNRVKKTAYAYLLFRNFTQLMQLQAIIEEHIEHEKIQKVIEEYQTDILHEPKEIVSANKELTLRLYPCTEEVDGNRHKYLDEIVHALKQEQSFFIKTLICSLPTLKQILSNVTFNFNINFAINQQYPLIECDSIFNHQTQAARNLANKTQYQYYCMVKPDIINKDYKQPSNLKKEEDALKEILSHNIHEYEIGDYLINEVDEFNICHMIASNLEKMFFILSKKPTEQFIYLTYHQKLLRIKRNKNGDFDKLENAQMREISRVNEVVIRPAINRAFLTGQRYVAINLPFEHVTLIKLDKITRLSNGNHNLVRYYMRMLKQSQRYKVEIKPPFMTEYFQKVFAKHYTLKFDDKKLRSQVKSLELGYGNIEKWREKPFICMKATHHICQKVLKKFLLEYEQEDKKQ